jgi:hypothetical protein
LAALCFQEYTISGHREVLEEPKLEFRVHIIDLTSDDRQSIQFNPKHIPHPATNDRRSSVFHLPIGPRIVYEYYFLRLSSLASSYFFSFSQLLENEKLLLILADRDKYYIYLQHLSNMDAAIQQGKTIKVLPLKKVGEDLLFAFDEVKRMLAVCSSLKVSTMSRT